MLPRSFPRRLACYVHPAMRRFFFRRRRRFHVKRSVATRIRNRTLYYNPLPRVFPFYCKVCKLNSRFHTVIQNHDCSGKDESRHIVSFENEVRIALLGYKSRAKDALAVLERVPNPQNIAPHLEYKRLKRSDWSTGGLNIRRSIPKLRDLCMSSLPKCRIEDCDDTMQFTTEESENGHSSSKDGTKGDSPTTSPTSNQKITRADVHNRAEDLTPSQKRLVEKNRRNERVCNACFADGFDSDGAFHEHIWKCAADMVKLAVKCRSLPKAVELEATR